MCLLLDSHASWIAESLSLGGTLPLSLCSGKAALALALALGPPHGAALEKLFISRDKVSSNWRLFFFFLKHRYWSITALQWCVSFCFITK